MHKPRILFFDIDGTLIDMEKKRIKELRREQESQEKAEQDSDKK